MSYKQWSKLFFVLSFFIITFIFTFNFIIDPYSMTKYNLLNIPNKFARDDRVEKVAHIKTHKKYDNIILGSSRVYSTNPLTVSKYLGGTTYNCGVGTARIEDILGFILLLKKEKKLPKNLIIGLDFYSFNDELETNKYFLKNQDLNFLHKQLSNSNYISNFLSIDAFRASFKTLTNFIKNSKAKPRFDENGASQNASTIFSTSPTKEQIKEPFSDETIQKEVKFIKTIKYKNISKKRLSYLNKVIQLANKNNIKLYIFITPLNAKLLEKIKQDKKLYNQLLTFKKKISEKTKIYDFATINKITKNQNNFNNPTHFTPQAGNLLYAKLFNDKNITLPNNFGVILFTNK